MNILYRLFYVDVQLLFYEYCSISALSCSVGFVYVGGGRGGGGFPSNFLVSTQHKFWLFFFRRREASIYVPMSVGWLVGWSVGWLVGRLVGRSSKNFEK